MSWLSKLLGSADSKRAALDDFERGQFNDWLISEQLNPESALYSVYRGRPYSETDTGGIVIGVARPDSGTQHIGFCVELAFGTIVDGEVGPAAVAGRSNHYSLVSRSSGIGMLAQFRADAGRSQ